MPSERKKGYTKWYLGLIAASVAGFILTYLGISRAYMPGADLESAESSSVVEILVTENTLEGSVLAEQDQSQRVVVVPQPRGRTRAS